MDRCGSFCDPSLSSNRERRIEKPESGSLRADAFVTNSVEPAVVLALNAQMNQMQVELFRRHHRHIQQNFFKPQRPR